jgi:spore germination protein KB
MIQKTAISQRQFMLLLVSLLTTTSVINLPHSLIELSKGDTPFAPIFALVFALAFARYLVWLSKKYPQKNLFEIHEILLGRVAGTGLNILLLLHILFVLLRNLRLFNFFAKAVLLPNTPTEILLLLFMLIVIYYASSTIEVAARVNEIAFPLQLICTLAMPILLIGQVSTSNMEPFFTNHLLNIGLAGLTNCTWFGDIVVMGAFIQMLASKVQLKSALRLGIILSSCILCLYLLMMVLVYGPNMTENQVYPSFSLAMQIFITDFFDRMEMFFVIFFFPVYFINTVLVFIALMIGVATIAKSRNYTRFSPSFGLLTVLCSLFAFRGSIDVNIFANYGFPAYVLLVDPLAVCLVIVASLITDRKARKAGKAQADRQGQSAAIENHSDQPAARLPEQGTSGPAEDQTPPGSKERQTQPGRTGQTDQTGEKSSPTGKSAPAAAWSLKRWSWLTNASIVLAFVFFGVGLATGLDYQPVAMGCAIGYFASLLLCLFFAIREHGRARIDTQNGAR